METTWASPPRIVFSYMLPDGVRRITLTCGPWHPFSDTGLLIAHIGVVHDFDMFDKPIFHLTNILYC